MVTSRKCSWVVQKKVCSRQCGYGSCCGLTCSCDVMSPTSSWWNNPHFVSVGRQGTECWMLWWMSLFVRYNTRICIFILITQSNSLWISASVGWCLTSLLGVGLVPRDNYIIVTHTILSWLHAKQAASQQAIYNNELIILAYMHITYPFFKHRSIICLCQILFFMYFVRLRV